MTKESILLRIDNYPDFPSLKSISEIFDSWKICYEAYEVEFKELKEIKLPCLTILSGKITCLEKITKDYVLVTNSIWNKKKLSIESFKSIFQELAIVISKPKEEDYELFKEEKRQQMLDSARKWAIFATALIFVCEFYILRDPELTILKFPLIMILLIKITGLALNLQLLKFVIHKKDIGLLGRCGLACQNVLSSKQSEIMPGLSWAEIGFFYYSSTTLAILIFPYNNCILQMLSILNLICLPFAIFSVYYQWKVVKSWCRFCLSIQILLWVEFIFSGNFLSFKFHFPDIGILSIAFSLMLFPIIAWFSLKPYIMKFSQMQRNSQQFAQFKLNRVCFEAILSTQKNLIY